MIKNKDVQPFWLNIPFNKEHESYHFSLLFTLSTFNFTLYTLLFTLSTLLLVTLLFQANCKDPASSHDDT